jgi:Ribbon-helix-helix protein, copG family
MTVFKPRSRTVSVRLTEEEYVTLRALCAATGARSVSDLTRNAVRSLVQASTQPDLSRRDVEGFLAQIEELNRKVEKLAEQATSTWNAQR